MARTAGNFTKKEEFRKENKITKPKITNKQNISTFKEFKSSHVKEENKLPPPEELEKAKIKVEEELTISAKERRAYRKEIIKRKKAEGKIDFKHADNIRYDVRSRFAKSRERSQGGEFKR